MFRYFPLLVFIIISTMPIYADSISDLEQAITRNPGDVAIHEQLAVIYYEQGDLEKAISRLESVVQLAPDDVDSANNLAAAYRMISLKLQAQKKYTEALRYADKSISLAKRYKLEPVSGQYQRVIILSEQGEMEQALKELDQLPPESDFTTDAQDLMVAALLRQAKASIKQKDYQKALEQIARASQIDPQKYSYLHLQTVHILAATGETEKALEALNSLAGVLPQDNDLFQYRIGSLYKNLGETRSAVGFLGRVPADSPYYKRAQSLLETASRVMELMQDLRGTLTEGNLDMAVTVLRDLVKLDPAQYRARLSLAKLLFSQKDRQGALAELEVLSMSPRVVGDAFYQFEMGKLYSALEQWERSERLLKQIPKDSPHYSEAQKLLENMPRLMKPDEKSGQPPPVIESEDKEIPPQDETNVPVKPVELTEDMPPTVIELENKEEPPESAVDTPVKPAEMTEDMPPTVMELEDKEELPENAVDTPVEPAELTEDMPPTVIDLENKEEPPESEADTPVEPAELTEDMPPTVIELENKEEPPESEADTPVEPAELTEDMPPPIIELEDKEEPPENAADTPVEPAEMTEDMPPTVIELEDKEKPPENAADTPVKPAEMTEDMPPTVIELENKEEPPESAVDTPVEPAELTEDMPPTVIELENKEEPPENAVDTPVKPAELTEDMPPTVIELEDKEEPPADETAPTMKLDEQMEDKPTLDSEPPVPATEPEAQETQTQDQTPQLIQPDIETVQEPTAEPEQPPAPSLASAQTMTQQGREDEAISELGRLVADPAIQRDDRMEYEIGILYMQLGDEENSKKHLRNVSAESLFYRAAQAFLTEPVVEEPAVEEPVTVPDEEPPPTRPLHPVEQRTRDIVDRHRIETSLALALIRQESSFNKLAVSGVGAAGLCQIMPATGRDLGLKIPRYSNSKKPKVDPKVDERFEPYKCMDAGFKYLRQLLNRYDGNVPLALSAYNAGMGRTKSRVARIYETTAYVSDIMTHYWRYQDEAAFNQAMAKLVGNIQKKG